MTRRFQLSLRALLVAIAIVALAPELLRGALDSGRRDVLLLAVLALPIILGAATGRLFGHTAEGVAVITMAYLMLGFLLLALLATGAIVWEVTMW